ncbi:MAG: adenylate kinase [Fibrobacterota bacterium]
MHLILLGPPGVGKGTCAVKLVAKYGIPQISTGDILRAARKEGTEMGKKAAEYMDSGRLVPDDVIVGIIEERLKADDCKNGEIFDGFPRTVEQAKALDEMFKKSGKELDAVIKLTAPDDLLIKRLSGRRMCKECNANYNIYFGKPSKEGICDKCGGELYQRDDDNEATIKNRLKVFYEQTSPLDEYYKKQNKIIPIDASNESDGTVAAITAALEDK